MSNSMTFLRNATWGCGLVAGVGGWCVRRGWCHMLVCILLSGQKTTIKKHRKILKLAFVAKKRLNLNTIK